MKPTVLPPPTPPADPYYMYAPQPHSDPQRQGIVTLFVAGLPDDVKPREIHNLFSHRPGFDHCLLEYTGRGNQAVAFVTFFTHQEAMSAMTALNGTVFDPETGASLHIELARSNSRRRRGGGDVYSVIDKRTKRADGNNDHGNNSDEGDDGVWGEDDDDGGNVANLGSSIRRGDLQMINQTNLQLIFHLVLLCLLQIWDIHAQKKSLRKFCQSTLDSMCLKCVAEVECL